MNFRRFIVPLASLALLAFVGALSAQSDHKGRDIIDKSVAALGGDRFLNMRYRVARGRVYSFFHDQLSALDVATVYTEYLSPRPAAGLALREREILGKKQDYSYLFLPDRAFDISYRGARPIPDESWQRYLRTTENDILYILKVRRDEPGMLYDYVGADVYLSTHVEIVDITDAQSRTVRAFFDYNTMLPIHETYSWLDPDTKYHNDEVADYDKYRDTGDGVMWPYSIERSRNGYKSYQMFATKVEANQSAPANTFELPPKAKLLRQVN
ncbi:MAG: hypothetical protein JO340_07085 [Acidobacteriaceae bacterium]|nr:hypothetical protein [Acidobacteriaceae bacterium]